mgnify:CR=1 FL=1
MSQPPTPEAGVPVCYRHPDRESHIRCQRCGRPICPDCMREASVGFQCPECVAEGHKQTRQARTAYGGLRPTNATLTSGVLIALNAAVWIAITITGGGASRLVDLLALRTNGLCLTSQGGFDVARDRCESVGTFLPGVVDGATWQLLTSGFAHVSIAHIAFNMFALYVLGPQLEQALGRGRFLALYFMSLLGGSVAVLWLAGQYGATLGASGAIYGLFAALFVMVRKVGGDLRQLGVLIAINVFITFAVPNISWQGHLGGFVVGGVVALLLVYAPRGSRRTTYQVLTVGAVGLLLAALVVARVALLS